MFDLLKEQRLTVFTACFCFQEALHVAHTLYLCFTVNNKHRLFPQATLSVFFCKRDKGMSNLPVRTGCSELRFEVGLQNFKHK
jgi:hypothetical protein